MVYNKLKTKEAILKLLLELFIYSNDMRQDETSLARQETSWWSRRRKFSFMWPRSRPEFLVPKKIANLAVFENCINHLLSKPDETRQDQNN